MKNLILSLFLLLSLSCVAQKNTEVVIQFAQGQYEMTRAQVDAMENQIQNILALNPNFFVSEIEARAWESVNISGILVPLSDLRGAEVHQTLNRLESTWGTPWTPQFVINPQQKIRSGIENQQVIIRFDSFL